MITTTTTRDAHVGVPAAPMPRSRPAALTRLAAWHWHRLALGAVLALAALLNFWALDRLGYANTYYAAAVKSCWRWALGGFSGSDQILSTQQLARLVANGTVHYFLIQSGGGPGGSGGNSALTQWVTTHGTVVPSSRYEMSSTSVTSGFGQTTLYYVGSVAGRSA